MPTGPVSRPRARRPRRAPGRRSGRPSAGAASPDSPSASASPPVRSPYSPVAKIGRPATRTCPPPRSRRDRVSGHARQQHPQRGHLEDHHQQREEHGQHRTTGPVDAVGGRAANRRPPAGRSGRGRSAGIGPVGISSGCGGHRRPGRLDDRVPTEWSGTSLVSEHARRRCRRAVAGRLRRGAGHRRSRCGRLAGGPASGQLTGGLRGVPVRPPRPGGPVTVHLRPRDTQRVARTETPRISLTPPEPTGLIVQSAEATRVRLRRTEATRVHRTQTTRIRLRRTEAAGSTALRRPESDSGVPKRPASTAPKRPESGSRRRPTPVSLHGRPSSAPRGSGISLSRYRGSPAPRHSDSP